MRGAIDAGSAARPMTSVRSTAFTPRLLMMANTQPDWTTGPAKLVAVVCLGGACMVGLAWSIATREPGAARAGVPLAAMQAPPVGDAGGAAPAGDAVPRVSIARRININTASAAELELLPGVGPAIAQRIVEFRDDRGPFRSLNDLDRVSGIGPRLIERLRDKVTLE